MWSGCLRGPADSSLLSRLAVPSTQQALGRMSCAVAESAQHGCAGYLGLLGAKLSIFVVCGKIKLIQSPPKADRWCVPLCGASLCLTGKDGCTALSGTSDVRFAMSMGLTAFVRVAHRLTMLQHTVAGQNDLSLS